MSLTRRTVSTEAASGRHPDIVPGSPAKSGRARAAPSPFVATASSHEAKRAQILARAVVSATEVGLAPWPRQAVDAVARPRDHDIEHSPFLLLLSGRGRLEEGHHALLNFQDDHDVELEPLCPVYGRDE
jgi:hypothetical protein